MIRKPTPIFLSLFMSILGSWTVSAAQEPVTGFPPYGSFSDGGFDVINRQNLNVNFAIPIVSSPGRGLDLSHSIRYDSLIWKRVFGAWVPNLRWGTSMAWGWNLENVLGEIKWDVQTETCAYFDPDTGLYTEENYTVYTDYAYIDPSGTAHQFNKRISPDPPNPMFCELLFPFGVSTASNGSGYRLLASVESAPQAEVTSPSGVKIEDNGTMTGRNGNMLTKEDGGPNETHYRDSVGRIALKIKRIGNTSVEYHVLDQNGLYQITTVTLQNLSIKTNFACSGITEYTGAVDLPVTISLPSGRSYSMTYEDTPGSPGDSTGRLKDITLPTGGRYSYEYPSTGNMGINCDTGNFTDLTRKIANDGNTETWIYARTQPESEWVTTVDEPVLPQNTVGNRQVFTFGATGQQISMKVYEGTTELLRSIDTTWAANGSPESTIVTFEDNQQKKTETTFDDFGNLTLVKEFALGTGTPGPLVRKTVLTYETDFAYANRNIRDLLVKREIWERTETILASLTEFTYDDYSAPRPLTEVLGAAQHNDAFGTGFTTRGNLTKVTQYPDPTDPASAISKYFQYDTLGNVLIADMDCCRQREWRFQKSTLEYSFPFETVKGPVGGPNLIQKFEYNPHTSLVTKVTDPNNQDVLVEYDDLGRITKVSAPKPGSPGSTIDTVTRYDDILRTIETDFPHKTATIITSKTSFDELGRPFLQCRINTWGTTVMCTDTEYDSLGRAYKVSAPRRTNWGPRWTTTLFDGLGRPISTQAHDGNTTTFDYAGPTVTITDPASRKRKSVSDGLGRLVEVLEPDVDNGNVLTVSTTYEYDTIDRLIKITQPEGTDVQMREMTYDALGRLLTEKIPETGNLPTSFEYDDHGLVTRRTDPRGVEKHFYYDGLLRLVGASYTIPPGSGVAAMPNDCTLPDSTPANVCFTYGTDPVKLENGRLIQVTSEGGNSQTFTYDELGRTKTLTHKIDGVDYPIEYTYFPSGQVNTVKYPSQRLVTIDYAGRGTIASVSDGLRTYVDTIAYNPADQITSLTSGNGVVGSLTFTQDRFQVTGIKYSHTDPQTQIETTLLELAYCYTDFDVTTGQCNPLSGANTGQISGIEDKVNAGRTVAYTYDALGRLEKALTQATTGAECFDLTYGYDRWANLKTTTPNPAKPTCTGGVNRNLGIQNITNHITNPGFEYDDAGNLTKEGTSGASFAYDGEDRLRSVNSGAVEYLYDGSALRLKKATDNQNTDCSASTTTCYIYSGTKVMAEYVGGTISKEYIYLGSSLLATIDNPGASESVTFHHEDHLSVRVNTGANGAQVGEQGHLPFGGLWYESSTTTKFQFTGHERDSETGLDYAIFRYNNNRLGRFMTPDPLASRIQNPQSLNRFTNTLNDPINLTDPMGLCTVFCTMLPGDEHYTCAWDCTGQGDSYPEPESEGEETHGGRRKKKLKDVLSEEECAKLVGGKENVDKLLAGDLPNIVDVNAADFDPDKFHNPTTGEPLSPRSLEALSSPDPGFGLLSAFTFEQIGAPIFVGSAFTGISQLDAQVIVTIHEFEHQTKSIPSERGMSAKEALAAAIKSILEIADKCGLSLEGLLF